MGKDDWNVGLELRDLLFDRYGFEQGPYEEGAFLKRVDSQHGVLINSGRWETADAGSTSLSVRIGFARHDNNLLCRQLLNDKIPEWRSTIQVSDPFGEGLKSFIGVGGRRPDIAGWLSDTVPRLEELANYRYIADTLTAYSAEAQGMDLTRQPRMAEALMGGWNDTYEDEFLAPMVAQLDEDPAIWKSDPDGAKRRARIDRVRAWIAEHPDGVERELID